MSNKPVGFRRLLHWSLRLLFPLALSAALCVGAVAQQEATITISRIAGAVEVQHDFATAGEWVLASTGQELASGWKLRTGSGAKAQLVFPQENVVILKENSVLFVDSLDLGGGATLKADEGSLLVDIRNALAAGSEFELVTPTALAVVRGTKYAAVEIDGYDVTFYGYDGAVEIMNDMGEGAVWLVADKAVDVIYGEIPSEPYDSPLDAEAFLADAEDTSGFDEAEGTAQAYVDQLGSLEVELLGYHEVLTEYQQEWRRYERRDQVTHMVVLYAQVLAVQAQVDDAAERFAALQGEIPEEIVGIAPLPEMLQHIAELFAQLYAMLEEFADDAEPIITDNEEILDMLNGLIGPGDPTLGLRWGLFDTDNDGISDIDEIALGLDPWAANDQGFIELIAPEDDDQVDYPEETELTFEFEMLDTDLVEEYQLVFEIGGQRWARRDVDDSEDVDLTPLVGENGVFQAALDDEGALALQWYVVAVIEEDQLFAQIAQQPGS